MISATFPIRASTLAQSRDCNALDFAGAARVHHALRGRQFAFDWFILSFKKLGDASISTGDREKAQTRQSCTAECLTFLSHQSLRYCPRTKRSRSNTRAGLVGYLFEAAHKMIAPMGQPGTYIRPGELSSIVEGPHNNVARKTKWWLEHEILMPRKLARHNCSSGSTVSVNPHHPRVNCVNPVNLRPLTC
jgi:hypothetical protein